MTSLHFDHYFPVSSVCKPKSMLFIFLGEFMESDTVGFTFLQLSHTFLKMT